MKKIAILRCLKSAENCTGAACLRVFNEKSAFFSRYQDEEIQLVAFWTCNGCEKVEFENEDGMVEKLERILKIGTDIVHIGICSQTRVTGPEKRKCEEIIKIADYLNQHNIKIVWGTHK